jgi:hypothetical protein
MVRREFCMVSDPQKNQRRTVVGSSSAPVLLVVMAPTSTGRSRRLADVADSGLGRLNWCRVSGAGLFDGGARAGAGAGKPPKEGTAGR